MNKYLTFAGFGGLLIALFFVARTVLSIPNSLVITWQIPTTYENGEALPAEQITGFDIYVTKDDNPETYEKWFPFKPGTETKHIYNVDGVGKYCFQLVTVSKENGKSERSPAECYIVIETGPVVGFRPDAPGNIQIEPVSE